MITVKQNCTHMDAFVQRQMFQIAIAKYLLGVEFWMGFIVFFVLLCIVLIVTIDVSLLQNTVLL